MNVQFIKRRNTTFVCITDMSCFNVFYFFSSFMIFRNVCSVGDVCWYCCFVVGDINLCGVVFQISVRFYSFVF